MTAPSPDETMRSVPTRLTAPSLFLLALVPRLHAVWLGFVTPDELNWVYRSIRFLQAVQSGRWADTMQTGHPGVITMWLGSLGVLWRAVDQSGHPEDGTANRNPGSEGSGTPDGERGIDLRVVTRGLPHRLGPSTTAG